MVIDDPEAPAPHRLPDDELLAECRVDTFRSGGAGGQHQNKTESGVRLTHLPTGLVATARESRSQHQNRRVALTRLRAVLEERARPTRRRVATKVPPRQKRRRLEEKRQRSQKKQGRRKPDPED
ncbi:MAG: peptide chain release factor-like protein [Gemmatimonadota bacterium]